jgi:hypothetical protein
MGAPYRIGSNVHWFNNKNDIAIKLVEQSKLLESVDEIGELTNDRIVTTASGSIKK